MKIVYKHYKEKDLSKLILTIVFCWLYTNGFAQVSGELKLWHKITVTYTSQEHYTENSDHNPFTDCRLDVVFTNGEKSYTVPGYFAADGNAANTGATSGKTWKVHFTPDEKGTWNYTGKFYTGKNVAISAKLDNPKETFRGSFNIKKSDKKGKDFRAKGILRYVGERYPRFDDGSYFVKGGPGDPENLLSIADFDNTPDPKHNYNEHGKDWKSGDSTWNEGRGKNIVGLINYLSKQGCNTQYFLLWTGGDDKKVWPWIGPSDYLNYDVSKLEQWEILFSHMTSKGIHLHLFLHEEEIDMIMNGGDLGLERKVYFREMIARFGHHNALTWNLGEEINRGLEFEGGKDPSTKQIKSWADYISKLNIYKHPVGIHTYPPETQNLYTPLLGHKTFNAATLQTSEDLDSVYIEVKEWIDKSKIAGHPWLVSNDEQGGAATGIDPEIERMNEYRKKVLWGSLMAGGWGVEYYFGKEGFYVNDFRKYEQAWKEVGYAIDFFTNNIPFWEMDAANNLVSNGWCFAKPGEIYVIYLEEGGSTVLDAGDNKVKLQVKWFNPRKGGELHDGSVKKLMGSGKIDIGNPPFEQNQDWVVMVKAF